MKKLMIIACALACVQVQAAEPTYDAAYVALAEALPATLLTRDARLAGAPGHGATIELI